MSHQALLSLPKLAARCQAMQVVMVLLFDEKKVWRLEEGGLLFLTEPPSGHHLWQPNPSPVISILTSDIIPSRLT